MSQDAEQLGLACCICLDSAADQTWIALSECGHMMHAGCLDQMSAVRTVDGKAPTCPFCRVRLAGPTGAGPPL